MSLNDKISYEELKPLLAATIEGYNSMKFPPQNPYAPFGVYPDETNQNILGLAWFYGYWANKETRHKRLYERDKDNLVK